MSESTPLDHTILDHEDDYIHGPHIEVYTSADFDDDQRDSELGGD